MFTNNYDVAKKLMFLNATSEATNFPFEAVIHVANGKYIGKGQEKSIHSPDPSYISIPDKMLSAYCKEKHTTGYGSSSSAFSGVFFGSGSTAATKDDWDLETPIESGLSIASEGGSMRTKVQSDGSWLFTRSYIVTNISEAPITIGEIGLFGLVYNGQYYYPTLLDRTVFASPATIAPNESKLVTYKIAVSGL